MQPRMFLVDEFQISKVTRSGGMARVTKAILVATGDACALKYPNDETDPRAAESVQREVSSLQNLEHRNIVRLLGLGTSGAERFLVLEWLEETLSDRVKSLGGEDWVYFYENVGRPILDALRYAHKRGHVHRDLKPMNVMFTKEKIPKITDFGIARNSSGLRLGATFSGTGSPPWTPLELDDGMYSERRDLYSWAAICVSCLSGRDNFKTAQELRAAVASLASVAPAEILHKCLSDSPTDRPADATVLLWDLDDYHRERTEKCDLQRPLGIEVSASTHEKLSDLAPHAESMEKRLEALFADFQAPCDIARLPEGDLEFTGQSFCMRAGRASPDAPWLLVRDIRPASSAPAFGPRMRATVRFTERTLATYPPAQLRASIRFIEDFLATGTEREEIEERRRDEERYINMLQEIVAGRMRMLRELPALTYRDGKWEGGDFAVLLDGEEAPETGEQRIIRVASGIMVFEVVRVSQARVYLRHVGQKRASVPPEGRLQVDTAAQRRALERQEEAVKTLRADLAVLPAHLWVAAYSA